MDLPWSSVQVHPDTMGNHGGSHVDICVCPFPCIGQCAVSGQECIRNCIICYSDVGCSGSQGRGQFFRPTALSVTLSLPAFPQSLFPMRHLAKAWYLAHLSPFD